ncbi:MAG: hypothetical protein LUF32_01850 [Clostridiales bacterium]|nr:hypothetical protein [Clostridiales bacterium]
MLGKLLKYEFKSFSRLLGIIYIAVLAVAAVTGLLLRGSLWSIYMSSAGGQNKALLIFIIIYIVVILALILITILMIIQRFYRSMLQGEGYLTHTLPVPTWMHIAGKTICSVVFTVIAGAVLLVSALMIFFFSGTAAEFGSGLSALMEEFGGLFWTNGAAVVLCVIAVLFQIIRMILMFYTSMAIGGSARKNKVFFSILAFIVIVIVINVISSLTNLGLLENLVNTGYYTDYGDSDAVTLYYDTGASDSAFTGNAYYVRQIIINAVYSVIFFAVSTFFLRRKLNLE